jgi:putative NADPH-quinone reductase
MTNILLIEGHPDSTSFNAALAGTYAEGARQAGATVERLQLSALSFDPVLRHGYQQVQALEPDLQRAQEKLLWAQHLVFSYPTWWGTPPALLKGFLDRTLLPGFAFKFDSDSTWQKLLKGRSARLLVTMDFPAWYYRWLFGAPGDKAMAKSTLGFCGVDPVRISHFAMVRTSKPEQRTAWLESARKLGAADA